MYPAEIVAIVICFTAVVVIAIQRYDGDDSDDSTENVVGEDA